MGCGTDGGTWSGSSSFRRWSFNKPVMSPHPRRSADESKSVWTPGGRANTRCWSRTRCKRVMSTEPLTGGRSRWSSGLKLIIAWCSAGSSGRRCGGLQRDRREASCNPGKGAQRRGTVWWRCSTPNTLRPGHLQRRVWTHTWAAPRSSLRWTSPMIRWRRSQGDSWEGPDWGGQTPCPFNTGSCGSARRAWSLGWLLGTLLSGLGMVRPLGPPIRPLWVASWSRWASSQGSGWSGWMKTGGRLWWSVYWGWRGQRPRRPVAQHTLWEERRRGYRAPSMQYTSSGRNTKLRRIGIFSSSKRATRSMRTTGKTCYGLSGMNGPVVHSLRWTATANGTHLWFGTRGTGQATSCIARRAWPRGTPLPWLNMA